MATNEVRDSEALDAERDEMHLVALDGRHPVTEYYRTALDAWEPLHRRIEETAVDLFDGLEIGEGEVDWAAPGLTGPAATWTHRVDDDLFADNPLLGLSTRASIGLIGVIALGPVLFAWGLWQRWKHRRRRRS